MKVVRKILSRILSILVAKGIRSAAVELGQELYTLNLNNKIAFSVPFLSESFFNVLPFPGSVLFILRTMEKTKEAPHCPDRTLICKISTNLELLNF